MPLSFGHHCFTSLHVGIYIVTSIFGYLFNIVYKQFNAIFIIPFLHGSSLVLKFKNKRRNLVSEITYACFFEGDSL